MDKRIEYGEDYKFIPMTSFRNHLGEEVIDDVFYYTDQIANVIFIGHPSNQDWILVDAGLPYGSKKIIANATERFGEGIKPKAVILTHGHFDHVGGLIDIIKEWKIPVYAHSLELPFLTGKQSYPDPDHTVEGGLIAKISSIFPTKPINLGDHVLAIPDHGEVPYLPDWRWVHTPGHSPGHIALFREQDGLLISGDALITVRQDSFYNVMMQKAEVNGPPRYLTTDWDLARQSVEKLASLPIQTVIPGHGPAMFGEEFQIGLTRLISHFDQVAVPAYGKYVHDKKNLH